MRVSCLCTLTAYPKQYPTFTQRTPYTSTKLSSLLANHHGRTICWDGIHNILHGHVHCLLPEVSRTCRRYMIDGRGRAALERAGGPVLLEGLSR